ncbi:hypothetical protein SDC9_142559 [bioreactor metagenome]|uniref:Uncharacterized protein n=1 Tax=bioreactor metagenome TaxID=1076179 RepID=A0A645E1K0_9ZZZZ
MDILIGNGAVKLFFKHIVNRMNDKIYDFDRCINDT